MNTRNLLVLQFVARFVKSSYRRSVNKHAKFANVTRWVSAGVRRTANHKWPGASRLSGLRLWVGCQSLTLPSSVNYGCDGAKLWAYFTIG